MFQFHHDSIKRFSNCFTSDTLEKTLSYSLTLGIHSITSFTHRSLTIFTTGIFLSWLNIHFTTYESLCNACWTIFKAHEVFTPSRKVKTNNSPVQITLIHLSASHCLDQLWISTNLSGWIKIWNSVWFKTWTVGSLTNPSEITCLFHRLTSNDSAVAKPFVVSLNIMPCRNIANFAVKLLIKYEG